MKLKAFYTSNTNKEEAHSHSHSDAVFGLSSDVTIGLEGSRKNPELFFSQKVFGVGREEGLNPFF